MQVAKKVIEVKLYGWDETPEDYRELLQAAFRARARAQAPYSRYFVGAAVRSARGNIYEGCNVECSTYTQTTHAEELAVRTMALAEGGPSLAPSIPSRKVAAVAVVAGPADALMTLPYQPDEAAGRNVFEWSIAPCGHCRQIIWENCHGDRDVLLIECTPTGQVAVMTIGDAFPFRFGPAELGIDVSK